MAEEIRTILEDWSEGVNTSLSEDRLPVNASPRGYNSVFVGIGSGGRIAIGKRHGWTTVNRTPVTGVPPPSILGQYSYRKQTAGVYTNYHLVVSDGGRLDKITSGTAVEADAANPAPFTAGSYLPDFDTANNLCFMVNGTDAKKFDGTSVTTFGITRPTVGTMAGTPDASGSPDGTYELRVTYGNSSTGHESSASNTATSTVTVTNKKIVMANVPVSPDAQVDRRYIYVRNTATMAAFYRAGTISDNSTTTITLDFADANLIIPAPDTEQNNPPPTGAKYCCWHVSRMFVATPTAVYYSSLDKPESFDPDNVLPISPEDGQQIRSIYSAFEVLLIFKDKSVYALFGTDPNSWQVRLVLADIGCVSNNTLIAAEGSLYWLAESGLMRMSALGEVAPIGATYLGRTFTGAILNLGSYNLATATADPTRYRILLAVPEAGLTRNTRIVAFNYRVGRFESDKWDPMDAADLSTVYDSDGNPQVMLGGYAGQIFQASDTSYIDGVYTGTTSGTVTSRNVGATVITDSGAAFDTTGGGLVERTVIFTNAAGDQTIRRRITANTDTTLTVPAATGVNAGWTYTIGGIDFQWDTPWFMVDPRFFKKRFRHLYATVEGSTVFAVEVMRNFSTLANQTINITATMGMGYWGSMLWGYAAWGGTDPYTTFRRRIGITGTALKFRIKNATPNRFVTVMAIGAAAELKSDRVN